MSKSPDRLPETLAPAQASTVSAKECRRQADRHWGLHVMLDRLGDADEDARWHREESDRWAALGASKETRSTRMPTPT